MSNLPANPSNPSDSLPQTHSSLSPEWKVWFCRYSQEFHIEPRVLSFGLGLLLQSVEGPLPPLTLDADREPPALRFRPRPGISPHLVCPTQCAHLIYVKCWTDGAVDVGAGGVWQINFLPGAKIYIGQTANMVVRNRSLQRYLADLGDPAMTLCVAHAVPSQLHKDAMEMALIAVGKGLFPDLLNRSPYANYIYISMPGSGDLLRRNTVAGPLARTVIVGTAPPLGQTGDEYPIDPSQHTSHPSLHLLTQIFDGHPPPLVNHFPDLDSNDLVAKFGKLTVSDLHVYDSSLLALVADRRPYNLILGFMGWRPTTRSSLPSSEEQPALSLTGKLTICRRAFPTDSFQVILWLLDTGWSTFYAAHPLILQVMQLQAELLQEMDEYARKHALTCTDLAGLKALVINAESSEVHKQLALTVQKCRDLYADSGRGGPSSGFRSFSAMVVLSARETITKPTVTTGWDTLHSEIKWDDQIRRECTGFIPVPHSLAQLQPRTRPAGAVKPVPQEASNIDETDINGDDICQEYSSSALERTSLDTDTIANTLAVREFDPSTEMSRWLLSRLSRQAMEHDRWFDSLECKEKADRLDRLREQLGQELQSSLSTHLENSGTLQRSPGESDTDFQRRCNVHVLYVGVWKKRKAAGVFVPCVGESEEDQVRRAMQEENVRVKKALQDRRGTATEVVCVRCCQEISLVIQAKKSGLTVNGKWKWGDRNPIYTPGAQLVHPVASSCSMAGEKLHTGWDFVPKDIFASGRGRASEVGTDKLVCGTELDSFFEHLKRSEDPAVKVLNTYQLYAAFVHYLRVQAGSGNSHARFLLHVYDLMIPNLALCRAGVSELQAPRMSFTTTLDNAAEKAAVRKWRRPLDYNGERYLMNRRSANSAHIDVFCFSTRDLETETRAPTENTRLWGFLEAAKEAKILETEKRKAEWQVEKAVKAGGMAGGVSSGRRSGPGAKGATKRSVSSRDEDGKSKKKAKTNQKLDR
ncbi:hypothetical protein HDU93_005502 [Gonapodya sp. JEL0774]|nr:hypothetical protein HDU93_005502 [Gonapodya sp. JEL0774]